MKKFTCLCAMLCGVLLLSACQNGAPPVDSGDTADTSPEVTDVQPPETTAQDTLPPETAVETVPAEDVYATEVEVRSVGPMSVSVSALTKGIGRDKTHVRVIPSLGYACAGYEYKGVSHNGDTIPLTLLEDGAELTLRMDYATLELPIVRISVNGQAIASKTDYVNMTFSLENTESGMIDVSGGIRLRGNSTAEGPKKPYRIRFEQKQSLFGLEKARSWVLLAEYLDPSCLHNYAAMYLGAASDELSFTPTIHHVNLYLDGEYMGLYSLCEQVQEQRLDMETEVTADMSELTDFNFLVCMNERAPEEDQPYFFVPSVGRFFQLKYPEREEFVSTAQFNSFMAQLEAYYFQMADAFNGGDTSWIRSNIHMDALIDHLIIDQIMGEEDHVWKSFYSYHVATDADLKGKLCFGPIWDYDYSLLTPWTGEPNECYDIDTAVTYSNFFYQGLMRSRLGTKVEDRYKQHYADVLTALIGHLQEYRDTIDESLALNQARWYGYDPDLTEDNFDFLIDFLESRQKVLKREWG